MEAILADLSKDKSATIVVSERKASILWWLLILGNILLISPRPEIWIVLGVPTALIALFCCLVRTRVTCTFHPAEKIGEYKNEVFVMNRSVLNIAQPKQFKYGEIIDIVVWFKSLRSDYDTNYIRVYLRQKGRNFCIREFSLGTPPENAYHFAMALQSVLATKCPIVESKNIFKLSLAVA